MGYDLNFGGMDIDPEDRCRVETGWHLAMCVDARRNQKDGKIEWVWRFTSAPWEGHILVDGFNRPDLAKTNEDAKAQLRRLGVALQRMGVATKEELAGNYHLDERKAIGTIRVLQIERGRNRKKPEDSNEYTNVVYGGYWDPSRPEIPVAERIRLGLPLLPGQVAPSASSAGSKSVKDGASAARPGGSANTPVLAFDPAEV